jgi:hypothetical protein
MTLLFGYFLFILKNTVEIVGVGGSGYKLFGILDGSFDIVGVSSLHPSSSWFVYLKYINIM